jgi:hypothetical protein
MSSSAEACMLKNWYHFCDQTRREGNGKNEKHRINGSLQDLVIANEIGKTVAIASLKKCPFVPLNQRAAD